MFGIMLRLELDASSHAGLRHKNAKSMSPDLRIQSRFYGILDPDRLLALCDIPTDLIRWCLLVSPACTCKDQSTGAGAPQRDEAEGPRAQCDHI